MGRANARDAGRAPLDPALVFGLILLGFFVTALIAFNVGVRVSTRLTGIPAAENIPGNPFSTVGLVLSGKLAWTTQATIVAVALVAVVVIVCFLIALLVVTRHSKTPREDQASKHLAARDDVESLSEEQAKSKAKKWLPAHLSDDYPGLRLGKVPGTKTGLYSTWEDLYLVVFGPRMGKTTSQVIPAIVDAPGPVVTTSNKRDIIDDTIKITGARGQVYAFDPQRIAAGFEQEPWFFDPLDIIRVDPATMDAAAAELADIFKCAAMGDTAKSDPFFTDAGRDLLARLFLAAAVGDRPITDVYLWVNDDTVREPVALLEKDGSWPLQAQALAGQYQITERTRSGIFSNAAQMAAPLGRREAARWVTENEGARRFDPAAFVRSEHDTLYLLSKEGADNAAALTTALTAAVMKAAERYGEENGGRLPVPLVAPLDEAANVVKWPQLPRLYSHYGSRSIILMTILQSYAQGVSVWGEEGMEALWSAATILLYGGGVRDQQMLTKLEALVGEYEEWEKSVSHSGENRTVSHQTREKKILTVSELASLGHGRALVFASKRRPLVAQMEPFWERTYWPDDIRRALPQEQ